MSLFYLVRHGTTDVVDERISGRTSAVHLNAAGEAQVERVAQVLVGRRIEAIYSSPLERAQESARPLCRRLDLRLEIEEAFNEVDFGEWTNCTFQELREQPAWRRFNAFRSSSAPPGGELMLAVQGRAIAGLEEIRRRHRVAAVFSHGDVIRGIVAHFLGFHLDLIERLKIAPASITILELDDWGAQIRLVNGRMDEAGVLAL